MNTRNRVTGDCAPNERNAQKLSRRSHLLRGTASVQFRGVLVRVTRDTTIHDHFCPALAVDLVVDAEVGKVEQRMAAAGAVNSAGFAGNDDDVHDGRSARVGQSSRSKSQTTDTRESEQ
jgi:hypothetical protein